MPTTEKPSPDARLFDLGDILTITTGRLVASRHMAAVYEVLDFMTGDKLFTHQLPRAGRECAPRILEQHPALAAVVEPELDGEEAAYRWVAEQKLQFGDALWLVPIAAADHTRIDPFEELALMGVPASKIIPVVVDGS